MQFSDTTAKLGIIQACERYCNLGDATISGTTLTLQEFTAHCNSISRRIWHTIFMSYGGWQYEDGNQTDLPNATTTITADQVSYSLPNGSLTVRGVEVKNEDGNWSVVHPITEEQIRERQAVGEFYNTSNHPLYYQLVGQTIRLYPASDYTQAASLKVSFDRGSVAFASSDTTATPGFASEYHDIIPIGASLEYLKIKQPGGGTIAQLQRDYLLLENNIKQYYSSKFSEMFPPRLTVKDQARDNI